MIMPQSFLFALALSVMACSRELPEDTAAAPKADDAQSLQNSAGHKSDQANIERLPGDVETESIEGIPRPDEMFLSLMDVRNMRTSSQASGFSYAGVAVTKADLEAIPAERTAYFSSQRRKLRLAWVALWIFKSADISPSEVIRVEEIERVKAPAWAASLFDTSRPLVSESLKAAIEAHGGSISYDQLLNYLQSGLENLEASEKQGAWGKQLEAWQALALRVGDNDKDGRLTPAEWKAFQAAIKDTSSYAKEIQ